jgi:hypothetical protein
MTERRLCTSLQLDSDCEIAMIRVDPKIICGGLARLARGGTTLDWGTASTTTITVTAV